MYSIYIYLFQFSFFFVFYEFVYVYGWKIFISNAPMTVAVYAIFVLLSVALTETSYALSKKKGFGILKYSM
ncbi:MAG: hypothetical protein NC350_04840 [Corallococcus sp.]|nr:hypothetical protein [Corallococcus sp.]